MKIKFLTPSWMSLATFLVFFLISAFTLHDYGTSWDETLHFSRGQAYLNFYLTGNQYYDQSNPRKSFYQLDYQNGDYWFKDNGGHPPINGTLAAVTNYIFYQKLNILSDIASYQVFNIFVSALLVFVITYFIADTLGLFPALISFLAISTYPLFFAEAHFNVKDPAETAFFTATIWAFYNSLAKGKYWLLVSAIFFGLALGTKFNILFLPFIIIPYLIFRYKSKIKFNASLMNLIPGSYLAMLLIGAMIVTVIFIGTWPYLWSNFPGNLFKVFEYYKQIGTGTQYQPAQFYFHGFNLFPIQWIIFTTPPLLLILFLVGCVSAFKSLSFNKYIFVLWLLWVLVPIIRVSLPGATIYGGDRQIMEFLPALIFIASIGAWQIPKLFQQKYQLIIKIVLILAFLWPTYIIYKLHPEQNVYFNFLIGGLQGAEKKNFPSWGNSYGNAYLSGIQWINQYAENGARVALIQGTETNTPVILFRSDIKLSNSYWSGLDRRGEYLMDLTFNDTGKAFYYTWEYVNKFLDPVYELRVDGVAILKIWKNDSAHFKPEYKNLTENLYQGEVKTTKVDNKYILDFDQEINFSRLVLKFQQSNNCFPITASVIETSRDQKKWFREIDSMPFPQVKNRLNLENNQLVVYFAGRRARSIRFLFDNKNSCGLNNSYIEAYQLLT